MVVSDPFAKAAQGGSVLQVGSSAPPPPAPAPAPAPGSAPAIAAAPKVGGAEAELERAFSAARYQAPQIAYQDDDDEYLPAGVPKASPRWVVPAIIGAVVLVACGALAMAFFR
jgi:hypothetical protein